MGIHDYISAMALPSWAWEENFDFPQMSTWDKAAQDRDMSNGTCSIFLSFHVHKYLS